MHTTAHAGGGRARSAVGQAPTDARSFIHARDNHDKPRPSQQRGPPIAARARPHTPAPNGWIHAGTGKSPARSSTIGTLARGGSRGAPSLYLPPPKRARARPQCSSHARRIHAFLSFHARPHEGESASGTAAGSRHAPVKIQREQEGTRPSRLWQRAARANNRDAQARTPHCLSSTERPRAVAASRRPPRAPQCGVPLNAAAAAVW